jgi:hypothetical protein
MNQLLKNMSEDLVYQIIYLSEAFHWGFHDIWNMPTSMRKKIINTYEEIKEKRKESGKNRTD